MKARTTRRKIKANLQAGIEGSLGERSRAGNIFVRRVGARADQSAGDLFGPVVLGSGSLQFTDRGGQIGGHGTVDVRFLIHKNKQEKQVQKDKAEERKES
jgi:hypothetical protein